MGKAAVKVKDPVRVKAGRKAKRKGNSNEREVANLLAAWWGVGEFMRTPSSGGWGKSRQVRDDFNAAGDIVTTATDFPFCVEVKSEERWELEQLLTSPEKCPIARWWKQAERETPEGKAPLLLFTRKLRPWYAMFQGANLMGASLAGTLLGRGSPTITVAGWTVHITLLASLTAIPRKEMVGMTRPTLVRRSLTN